MSDINLLPDELRDEENKHLNRQGGFKPPVSDFHTPGSDHRSLSQAQSQKIPLKVDEIKAPTQPQPTPAYQQQSLPVSASTADDFGLSQEEINNSQRIVEEDLNGAKELNLKAKTKSKKGLFSLFGKKSKGKIIKNQLDNNHKKFKADKEFDVNLVPEGANLLPSKKLYSKLILGAVIALLACGLGFIGLIFYGQAVKKQEAAITDQLSQSEVRYEQLQIQEKELSRLNIKIASVRDLLNRHVYWTDFFEELERITIPEVYYKSINASTDGVIILSAEAESYLALARQYLAYQQAGDFVKSVTVSAIEGNEDGDQIGFSVSLMVSPEIYYNSL